MTSSEGKSARVMARPLSRAGCLMSSLLSVAAISVAQPTIEVQLKAYPSSTSGIRRANQFTEGPDGAMWYTGSCGSSCITNDSIGRITRDMVITEYELPSAPYAPSRGPYGIATGPDGALWFTELYVNKIGRITTTGVFTEYALPSIHPIPGNPYERPGEPYLIVAGPDGAMWFTDGIAIGRITTAGVATIYSVEFRGPTDIVVGPDGALWFTSGNPDAIGRITIAGDITWYPTTACSYPSGIAKGPDDALWFACFNSKSIGRITTSGSISTFSIPDGTPEPNAGPVYITAGPDGALWFSEQVAPGQQPNCKLGRITTGGIFTEYSSHDPIQIGLACGEVASGLGDLWTNTPAGFISRIVVKESDNTPPVITPQITGTLGSNGWYRSAVTLSWTVTDPESGIASSFGCGTTHLTADTPGVTLTCSATNGAGLSASKAITIKIDQTPPVISGMPGLGCSIWPPDHKMIPVATVTAADAMSGIAAGSFKVTGASNESPSGPQISIVQSAGAYTVALLAERASDGTGRVYTLRAVASDQAGNTTTVNATCTVPHDQRN